MSDQTEKDTAGGGDVMAVEPRPALHVRILVEREDEDGDRLPIMDTTGRFHGPKRWDTLNRLFRVCEKQSHGTVAPCGCETRWNIDNAFQSLILRCAAHQAEHDANHPEPPSPVSGVSDG